jgi:hypothetical protein
MNAVVNTQEPESRAVVSVTPMHMLQMAVQQGADIDRLQKLMDLQERWEANQARKEFDAAMSAAKARIKPIIKNRKVDFTSQKGRTNYDYEDLAQIATEIDPILADCGLSYRFRSKQEGKKLSVTCIISHRDGHFEETTLTADNDESGNKNAIQSIGSAATFLQRYTLKLALGLSASKDDDGRGTGGGAATISESQIADLKALGEEVGANLPKFLNFMRVESLSDIKASDYKKAVAALEAKRAR